MISNKNLSQDRDNKMAQWSKHFPYKPDDLGSGNPWWNRRTDSKNLCLDLHNCTEHTCAWTHIHAVSICEGLTR